MGLTIVVPTRNRAHILKRNLEHHTTQFPGVEIIVSDNASDDNTADVAAAFPVFYHRNETNIGPHANFCKAHRYAQGEFVVYCGDDDLLDRKALDDIIARMRADPQLVMVQATWRLHGVDGTERGNFYTLPGGTEHRVETHREAFDLLTATGIIPEIFVCRGDFARMMPDPCPFIALPHWHLGQALNHGHVLFVPTPFLTATVGLPDQAGHKDAMHGWDAIRGGLEYLAGKAGVSMQEAFTRIGLVMAGRMFVALQMHNFYGNERERDALALRLAPFPVRI